MKDGINEEAIRTNLRLLRLIKGWTSQEASKELGFKLGVWSNFETGRRSLNLKEAMRITSYFKVELSSFLTKEGRITIEWEKPRVYDTNEGSNENVR